MELLSQSNLKNNINNQIQTKIKIMSIITELWLQRQAYLRENFREPTYLNIHPKDFKRLKKEINKTVGAEAFKTKPPYIMYGATILRSKDVELNKPFFSTIIFK